MGERVHKYAERTDETEKVDTDMPVVEPAVDIKDIDKLLDLIDDLLEDDADDFVRNYQQRGGQ